MFEIKKKSEPMPYYHKPPMRFRDFEIHYNRDYSLNHIVRNKHSYYEFYFLISGDVTYYIEDREFDLKPGAIILIAPEQYHQATINTRTGQAYERYVLWLDPEYLKRLSTDKSDLLLPFQKTYITSAHIQLTRDMQILINNLLEMILTSSVSKEYGADLLTNSYIIELLVHIARMKLFQQDTYLDQRLNDNPENSPIITNTLNYINSHIYEDIRIQDITDYLYISRSYLSRVFNEEMGLSVHQFIAKKKLFLARQDLLGGTPVKEICQKYSFGNYSSFYRAFRTEFGQSPRAVRKNV
ncbi:MULTISPECIES: AraC family transcriptional regulator [Hungatella]|mgnify:CR=1 FL=1|uniref:AraC family transcriptional regulator n=1 Tax=Hungatella hathewayi TaxID=154046 RepID=A0AA37JJC5_9FIRM|nr:AraC family transcriptional regulator [Hungatella hathewayi]MBS6756517.1 helix-turn-helix domain-containing protein [Hungatella hathewayi]MBT9795315.1 helix-turn-helix domain-containing protein [Hungatella hathewayi]RGZ02956.1 AraC family transcriptional regulator [Hungatella hathewayi]GKG99855.1 AraC family transcriptional regulator [Hungatella hathewayi]GKH06679.1 AraC family transcriptional regulator [Hungatella hathewayi]